MDYNRVKKERLDLSWNRGFWNDETSVNNGNACEHDGVSRSG